MQIFENKFQKKAYEKADKMKKGWRSNGEWENKMNTKMKHKVAPQNERDQMKVSEPNFDKNEFYLIFHCCCRWFVYVRAQAHAFPNFLRIRKEEEKKAKMNQHVV